MQSLGTSDIPHDRKVEIRVIKRVVPYLWPEGQSWVKRRVVISVVSLILAKGGNEIEMENQLWWRP